MQGMHAMSQWYGRDDEILLLRRLQRREAQLGDEMKWLRSRENQLEEQLFIKHNGHRMKQQAVMAAMEDCDALTINADSSMQMTPIGALGSVFAFGYPLFAAGCLCVVDEIDTLRVGQFAALLVWVVCSGQQWAGVKRKDDCGEGDDDLEDDALNYSALKECGRWESSEAAELASGGNGMGSSDESNVYGLPAKNTGTV